MKNNILEKAKQWIGDLLYENGVHQRETHIFVNAENELQRFFEQYDKELEKENDIKMLDFIIKIQSVMKEYDHKTTKSGKITLALISSLLTKHALKLK